ncbi:choice-of-anchor Q domain-containing protein [Stieleria mannarensis]|uniref:choice-of-anchor Q domain-containing protein n=1 Tax=Stieleria mannarensis TaxID=2755585 RepID=UPI001601D567|nr:choice-of-anchor Q domain-containing protein [Rhodopirellula sp. JC639]
MRKRNRPIISPTKRHFAIETLENRFLLSSDLWALVDGGSHDDGPMAERTDVGVSAGALYQVDHPSLLRAVESAPIRGSLGPEEPADLRPDREPGRVDLPIGNGVLQAFRLERHLTSADRQAGGISKTGTYYGQAGGVNVRLVVGPSTLMVNGQSIEDVSDQFQIFPTIPTSPDDPQQYRLVWADETLEVMPPPPSIDVATTEATELVSESASACTLLEDFDNVSLPTLPTGWTTSFAGVNWQTLDFFSDSPPHHAVIPTPPFASDNTLTSPVFTLHPSNTQLAFRTAYEMFSTSHGGVLEISIDGSPFVDIVDAGGQFVTGGYDAPLVSPGNPLAGRHAWTGMFPNYKDAIVDLPANAAGEPIQLRWRMATDGDFFNGGWRIDTISLCAPQATMDYGDAPDPLYPTLQSGNGASHVVGGPLYLGDAVDAELDGHPDPTAMGDDLSGIDDDDGVLLPPVLRPGQYADVTVIASVAGGRLNAWVDFNNDGDWADSGEQVFTDRFLNAGPNQLRFFVPHTATGSAATQLRFRVSTQTNLSYDGPADDGEVEDYAIATAMNVFEVDTLDSLDDGNVSPGNLSLREAIRLSNQSLGFDLITFSPDLAGGTIFAIQNGFTITDDVSIVGLGSDQMTLSGNDQVRVFEVNWNVDAVIGDVTITDGRVIGSGGRGGGIYSQGNLQLLRSVVRDSVAPTGGGIYQAQGTLSVTDSSIIANTAEGGDGGGILGDNAAITIEHSEVIGNRATTGLSGFTRYGGGIAMRTGELTITDSTLDGNYASASGGGLVSDGAVHVAGSTISNNSADVHGGGLFWGSQTGTAEIINSTFSGNGTINGQGGAIMVFGGPLSLIHSTVTDNAAGIVGGISTAFGNPTSTAVTIASSIVAGNQQVDIDSPFGSNAVISGGFNVVGNLRGGAIFAQTGDQSFVQDPGLAPLDDNGGPTKTHALFNNSPARNMGDPAALAGTAEVPRYDQRGEGHTRVDDGRIDIGAFEGFQARPPRVRSVALGSRSVLSSLGVFFDSLVDVTAPSAFKITNRDTNQVLDSVRYSIGMQQGPDGNTSVVNLSFDPGVSVDTMLNGLDSLSDGNYLLEINPAFVKAQGFDVFMEEKYTFGDEEADRFFRLFGDRDGDRDVDGQDYGRFGLTFLKSSGDLGYDRQFDSDGDRDVDGQDYGRFGARFLKQLPF